MIAQRAIILAGILSGAAILSVAPSRADDKPIDAIPVESTRALGDFSKASETLYKKISGSLVRVKMDAGMAGVAGPQLWKEFEDWRQKQLANSAQHPGAPSRPDRRPHPDADGQPATMPARAPGNPATFRRFLEQKLKDTSDPEAQSNLHAIMAHLEAARAGQGGGPTEITGVVIDNQGHTLVAWGWVRENTGAAFRVTTSDGTEVGAKYVGAHVGRGVAVIQLDSPGTAALPIAEGRPEGGELLMCMVARQASVGWVTAPAASASASAGSKKGADDRFAVFGGEDRGPTYLFNAKGELAAIGNEKFALPMEVLKDDIAWIIENKKDITPRRLGVKYAPVLPEMRKKIAGLGDKAAVIVQEVAPGSAAEKAGLKKDDILLAIDEVSIGLLPQIQVDLSTRTGSVPVEIFRAGKQLTLDMPLGEKQPPTPAP